MRQRTTTSMVGAIRRMLHQAGVTGLQPVYVRSDDCQSDDAIELRMAGVPVSLSLQIGCGYFGVNRYLYEDGELDGFVSVYFGDIFDEAARKLIAAAAEG